MVYTEAENRAIAQMLLDRERCLETTSVDSLLLLRKDEIIETQYLIASNLRVQIERDSTMIEDLRIILNENFENNRKLNDKKNLFKGISIGSGAVNVILALLLIIL